MSQNQKKPSKTNRKPKKSVLQSAQLQGTPETAEDADLKTVKYLYMLKSLDGLIQELGMLPDGAWNVVLASDYSPFMINAIDQCLKDTTQTQSPKKYLDRLGQYWLRSGSLPPWFNPYFSKMALEVETYIQQAEQAREAATDALDKAEAEDEVEDEAAYSERS